MAAPMFIAEVSSNHHQDLQRCLNFIDCAAEMGCDAVKFQLFRIDQLFAPEVLARSADHRRRREWELPSEWLPDLAAHCRQRNVLFSCTPFDLDAVSLLADHVAFFKIASYELTWPDLLIEVAKTGKPVLLSTGMADLDEVRQAAETIKAAGCNNLTLLHCSSAYPTPPKQANLAAIETIRAATQVAVGWSDHTRSPAVIHRAVHRWQASCIEFHLDLEGDGGEYATGHCWLPREMAPVIADVRLAFQADGSGAKEPNAVELPDRPWRADPSDGLRPFRSLRERLDEVLPAES